MRSTVLATLLCLAASSASADTLPTYDAFRTGAPYQGPLAKPMLADAQAKAYRTRLIDGARQRPNFASRFHLVTWGCGTSCSMGAAEDAVTGKVVFIPFSICCYAGAMDAPDWDAMQFRADSSLIVFHGQRNEEGVNGDHYYSFDGSGFRLLATKDVEAPPATPVSAATAPAPITTVPQPVEVRVCQKIADDGARLKCYDAVTGYRR